MSAEKHDTGKLRLSLVPPNGVEAVARVMQFGERKYAAHNFLEGEGLGVTRMIEAAMRHISQHNRGEDLDPESGLLHLAHAGAELLMALETIHVHGWKGDERPACYKQPKQ